jgi:hypothetical protein
MSEGELKKRFDTMFHDPDYEMSEATIFRLNVNLDEAKQEFPSSKKLWKELPDDMDILHKYEIVYREMDRLDVLWFKKWFGGSK